MVAASAANTCRDFIRHLRASSRPGCLAPGRSLEPALELAPVRGRPHKRDHRREVFRECLMPRPRKGSPLVARPRRASLFAKALPIHEVAFPVHVQLASSDSQFQRGVERQPSDFRLLIDREQRRSEHDAQNGKAEQASQETPPPPFPEGNERTVPAVPRIRHRAGMAAGRLARIEPVGDQDLRTLISATAVSGHRSRAAGRESKAARRGVFRDVRRDGRDGCRAGQQRAVRKRRPNFESIRLLQRIAIP